jgi:membrane-bound lytic murein transglycosylase B
VTSASARSGKKFLDRYSNALHRAEINYGVPAEIIVAIIGIETRYGKVTGSRRVLDSLISLALGYPRRSAYFLGELKEYLRLSGEGITNPLETRGSYAGAIGIPQFMPGSYRHYAVDFDNDGRSDLVRSVVDAIGSIANYLYAHGWHSGQPVVQRLSTDEFPLASPFVTGKFQVDTPVENLAAIGINLFAMDFTGSKVGIIRLQFSDHDEIRVGYPNFFVVTRYNRSQSYAMAVFELAEKIAK